ncbi:GntR family transcriptional regulator [Levilactobacillus andaensis]|uniref:GntR family transcriptional regulator n=1 Tax=Levilactobacillus andaensis TaxID=2799570 RepID=UPI001941610E|nr:GntR family transcriptional regulator [Levilactobacillus andaensis]
MENKYQKVKDGLKEDIISGKYQVNEKLPTESELMKQYSVSRYTVRRAVGDLESDHFIYRIQGGGMFVQDWHKDWSTPADTKLIGVITTHIADYIFPNIISGIDQVLSQAGYSILLSNTHNNHDKERKSLISMLDSKVAGLIIEPTQSALPNPNQDLYQEIKDDELPTLFINAHYPSLDFPYVDTNDLTAEQEMVDYLFGLGHQSILGIFQVDDIQGVDRMNGFVRAYQQRPELSYMSNIIMYQSGEESGKLFERIANYLKQTDAPTAIACYNDQLAIEVIDFLKSQNLRVPEDISVVGFDNYKMGEYFTPSLTTLNHEKERMGADAANLLIKMLNHESIQPITYQTSIVERNSAIQLKK